MPKRTSQKCERSHDLDRNRASIGPLNIVVHLGAQDPALKSRVHKEVSQPPSNVSLSNVASFTSVNKSRLYGLLNLEAFGENRLILGADSDQFAVNSFTFRKLRSGFVIFSP